LAEILIVHHIIPGEDPVARHTELHQVIDVTLAADKRG
jgi:hypothetical protein